ncbi:hypothetical protein [Accumulibacter sp.]|uniref:hypothetical protein n=1 Tax=Accumulibacter sp. TaxID=2053492 RepID=UPI0025D5CE86|nr:hypothetical protein [Accumulibacter sp.]MCM8596085.1 hypothetical protein [Accumulibacter sp.]MCM8627014.1 hypothetical protein [Accumulibacter sp.]MDS4050234.1 hypothetical protein [Accumulibacter sp.]
MRNFTGNWTATGSRQVLGLENGREAGIFALSGALMLSGKQRLDIGFRAEAIGFTDSASGLEARSVWTDERGDKVFSELHGEHVGAGKAIEGRFTGGTGRWTGISGGYSFKWKRIDDGESGEVVGRVVGLNGWAQLPEPDATKDAAAGGSRENPR